MSRILSSILPYPALSLALLAMWLLLHNSASPTTLLGGVILAIAAPRTLLALEAERLMLKRPFALVTLTGIVVFDIIRSNIAVGKIIYGGKRSRTTNFVAIPLDMRNRYGLSILATIITCTPGTLWVEYDSARSRVLLHVLDVVEPNHWVTLIKGRYERLLMECFE